MDNQILDIKIEWIYDIIIILSAILIVYILIKIISPKRKKKISKEDKEYLRKTLIKYPHLRESLIELTSEKTNIRAFIEMRRIIKALKIEAIRKGGNKKNMG